MNKLSRLLLAAAIPLAALTACGGGDDLQDRLDVADPSVRFVHASLLAPNLTLYRNNVAQPDATNVPYKFAGNYFDIDMGVGAWSVKTAAGGVPLGADQSIDPTRGTKYTIVALPASATDSTTYVIVDPYNKPLTSQSTRLRVMNASFNASSIDIYMNAPGTDISTPGVNALIAGTAYKTSGPVSGADSIDIPGGTYTLTVTATGSKTPIYKANMTFGNNQDILLITIPDSVQPGGITTLEKIEGTAGAVELTAIP